MHVGQNSASVAFATAAAKLAESLSTCCSLGDVADADVDADILPTPLRSDCRRTFANAATRPPLPSGSRPNVSPIFQPIVVIMRDPIPYMACNSSGFN
jgi:hypothetical protein